MGKGLDFPHTCGDIDLQISEAKDAFIGAIESTVEDCCPKLYETDKLSEIVEDQVNYFFKEIEKGFEIIRGLNEDMRRQAEWQLEDMQEEIDELNAEISDYQEKEV